MRRDALAALVLLTAAWAGTLWLPPFSEDRINDLFVYSQFARPVLDGALPYRDAFLEYPPLAAPAIALPGVLGTGEEAFRLAFAGWTLFLAAAAVLLTGALAVRTGGNARRAMLAMAAAPLLLGALARTHFDLAPVVLILGALVLLCDRRPRLAFAVVGLGAMTKGFPLVAAPIALAWLAGRGERRAALQGAACLALVITALAGAAVAMSPDGALDAVRYHTERPVQVESTAASVLLALDGAGLGTARGAVSHRSDGLVHPADDLVVGALFALLAAVLCGLALAAARGRDELPERRLVLASLAAIAAFAVLGKVLSPQYLIWIAPLGALAFAWRMHALAAAVAGAALLTRIEFPELYLDVATFEPPAVVLVAVRNAVLLGVVALAATALPPVRRPEPGAVRSPLPARRRRPRPARR
jgi:Glycosyltransferase family 87